LVLGRHRFREAFREAQAPPEDDRRPPAAPREQLIEKFRAGADHLVNVLRAANGEDAVWTWAPAQQDIDFITRHQVQEAAVHRGMTASRTVDRRSSRPNPTTAGKGL
jgi:hypothetical protein